MIAVVDVEKVHSHTQQKNTAQRMNTLNDISFQSTACITLHEHERALKNSSTNNKTIL